MCGKFVSCHIASRDIEDGQICRHSNYGTNVKHLPPSEGEDNALFYIYLMAFWKHVVMDLNKGSSQSVSLQTNDF